MGAYEPNQALLDGLQITGWASGALGALAVLLAALGLFRMASTSGLGSLNISALCLVALGLEHVTIMVFYAASSQLIEMLTVRDISLMFAGANIAFSCFSTIAWIGVTVGILLAKPSGGARVVDRTTQASGGL